MCGCFTQRLSWSEIHALLSLYGPARNLRPRYNVAPTQSVAAVRLAEGEHRLSMLRWGWIPGWARDPSIGSRLINARSETVHTMRAFRAAWRARRRCLIPCDGFYERTGPRGSVCQPWLIAMEDGDPFAMAGLWEHWTVREDAMLKGSLTEYVPRDVVETFTILTTLSIEGIGLKSLKAAIDTESPTGQHRQQRHPTPRTPLLYLHRRRSITYSKLGRKSL